MFLSVITCCALKCDLMHFVLGCFCVLWCGMVWYPCSFFWYFGVFCCVLVGFDVFRCVLFCCGVFWLVDWLNAVAAGFGPSPLQLIGCDACRSSDTVSQLPVMCSGTQLCLPAERFQETSPLLSGTLWGSPFSGPSLDLLLSSGGSSKRPEIRPGQ